MQFGVCLPHRWKYASARLIADVAQEAESLRFRIQCGSRTTSSYPAPCRARATFFYEALMTLAFVSSITRTVALGHDVLATPPRNPVVLAREVATLDALSGARVILGLGTGWIREELEAVGVTWTERGRFLDEGIQVLTAPVESGGPISSRGGTPTFERCCSNRSPLGGVGRRLGSGMTDPSLRRVRPDGGRLAALGGFGGRAGRRSGEDPRDEWGRKITLACFSPADIGSKSIEGYVGTLGERHHVITGSPEGVHTIADFRKSGLEHLAPVLS